MYSSMIILNRERPEGHGALGAFLHTLNAIAVADGFLVKTEYPTDKLRSQLEEISPSGCIVCPIRDNHGGHR